MYMYLYNPRSRSQPRLITDPILTTRGKSIYDVLLDALARSDNLRGLEGFTPGSSVTMSDLRVVLYRSISSIVWADGQQFILNHNTLTPDDTEQT